MSIPEQGSLTGCGAIILTSHFIGDSHPFFEQVDDNVRILLTRRGFRAPTFPGAWTCPGGLNEFGESFVETASREALEEVGLFFSPEDGSLYEGQWNGRALRCYLGSWSFKYPEGVRLIDGEAIGYDWVTFEEAMSKKLAFQYLEAIQKLKNLSLL